MSSDGEYLASELLYEPKNSVMTPTDAQAKELAERILNLYQFGKNMPATIEQDVKPLLIKALHRATLDARLDEAKDWLVVVQACKGQHLRCIREGKLRVARLKEERKAADA